MTVQGQQQCSKINSLRLAHFLLWDGHLETNGFLSRWDRALVTSVRSFSFRGGRRARGPAPYSWGAAFSSRSSWA